MEVKDSLKRALYRSCIRSTIEGSKVAERGNCLKYRSYEGSDDNDDDDE